MQVTSVMLADSVVVRDGMLNVLGGGINRLSQPSFPARMRASVALIITPDDMADLKDEHLIEVLVDSASSGVVVEFRLKWPGIEAGDQPSSPLPSIPIEVPTGDIELPAAGLYYLIVRIDGREIRRLEFTAQEAAEPTGDTLPRQSLKRDAVKEQTSATRPPEASKP
jgi:hypothetical protein